MVDSNPFIQGPPSRMYGILPFNWLKTCSAFVGLIFPYEFALGAANGKVNCSRSSRVTG